MKGLRANPTFWVIVAAVILAASAAAGSLALSRMLHGPVLDSSKFSSAKIAQYGRTGVFTFNRRIYRPASGLFPFIAGGPSKSLFDRHYIARYDIATGAVDIISEDDNLKGKWILASGGYSVIHTFGDRAVLRQSGQRRSDYGFEYHDYWLDLSSNTLTPLPIREELESMGYKPSYFYLVDSEGTLLIVSEPLDAAVDSESRSLWVRRPDGEYVGVGEFKHYYGYTGDAVHYWSLGGRYEVYELDSGRRRAGRRSEYPGVSSEPKKDLDLEVDFAVYYEGGFRLHIGHKIDGKWQYEPLALTVEELAPVAAFDGAG